MEVYCLPVLDEVVPIALTEETESTDASEAIVMECSGTQDKCDIVLLFESMSYAQSPLSHLSYVQESFIPDAEQLMLSQNHQNVGCGRSQLPAEKLCHLEDEKVNLHRASWGPVNCGTQDFWLPLLSGDLPGPECELLPSNFECYKV